MALTLIEASKINSGDVYKQGVIELFATSSGVLRYLPFTSIDGGAIKFSRENSLPMPGFRGINEGYKESTGTVDSLTEQLTMFGANLDVDKALMRFNGVGVRTQQEAMGIKALALSWERSFFKGDYASNSKEFNGLQARLKGSQLLSAGTTEGGDPLSLAKLDELIDQVVNPTHIFMNAKMRRLMTQASRSSGIAGFLSTDRNSFGEVTEYYQGLPIIVVNNDNEDKAILGFDEVAIAAPGAEHKCTSVYVASLSEGMLNGIDNGGFMVTDMGLQGVVYRTMIEWYSSIVLYHGKSAARLAGIKDSAVAA